MQKMAEYGYKCFVKQSNNKLASAPPCISCFFGARNVGRVLATLPDFAFSVATFCPHSDGAKSMRFVGSKILENNLKSITTTKNNRVWIQVFS